MRPESTAPTPVTDTHALGPMAAGCSARRAVYVLLALLVVALGYARLADPELRKATRAVTSKTATVALEDKAAASLPAPYGGDGGTPTTGVELELPRPKLPRPTPGLEPSGLPAGADALGVSLPRSRRWAVLGGHGRLGAG